MALEKGKGVSIGVEDGDDVGEDDGVSVREENGDGIEEEDDGVKEDEDGGLKLMVLRQYRLLGVGRRFGGGHREGENFSKYQRA